MNDGRLLNCQLVLKSIRLIEDVGVNGNRIKGTYREIIYPYQYETVLWYQYIGQVVIVCLYLTILTFRITYHRITVSVFGIRYSVFGIPQYKTDL